MVVPIRDLENKFTSTTSNTIPTQTFELPTVSYSNNTGMNIFAKSSSDNYDKVRGRSLLTKGNIFRNSSMFSMKLSIAYYEKMELNNAMVMNNKMDNISPALFYETDQEKALQVNKMAKQQVNTRFKYGKLVPPKLTPQCILNE